MFVEWKRLFQKLKGDSSPYKTIIVWSTIAISFSIAMTSDETSTTPAAPKQMAEGGRGRGRGRGGRGGGRGRGRGNAKNKGNSNAASEKKKNDGQKQQQGGRGSRGGRGRGRGAGRGKQSSKPSGEAKADSGSDTTNKKKNKSKAKNENETNKAHNKNDKKNKNKKETPNNNDNNSKSDKGKKGQNQNNNKKENNQGGKNKNANSKNKKKQNNAIGKSKKPSIPPNQPQQTSDIHYKRGEPIVVLHVGEKPSIAEAIAKGLCNGDRNVNKKVMPVHSFTNPSFPKAPHASKVQHKVTSVAGHVFSVDFPQEYQSWESVDPGELFHAPIKRKPCKGSIVSHLQNEAKGVDFIVLWMDCDREGENINFEVLDCCMHCMRGGGGVAHYDRVYRAYFSAINPSDILKAYNSLGKNLNGCTMEQSFRFSFSNQCLTVSLIHGNFLSWFCNILGKPDKNQALAVDARQELDLKVGVAFSRFQTRFFQGRYGDLDSSVLSYGPCQTPTMGFVSFFCLVENLPNVCDKWNSYSTCILPQFRWFNDM